ncbi:glutamyl-tRNA reductase [Phocicoccus pinnipedialis]|uniref:Glutamyl-tRNA reductase n=1 Tax=Phocicoccus pinnipedialis TaxID=110845 RepID=A0A6V7RE06_9BACL|nr:glutamyl-tRNA reductase [Jeotgalicoccus pinnipedialis]MBP1939449.1 glutamyl-tRNA reductase [Jeotgalicoccus pinnipedialis]CAD2075372.1 Glutamyl-tRNA reductase [Jeotgalicoccus pinnipedialis]
MHVVALSLNYRNLDVEDREKVTFENEELKNALHKLRGQKSILESVLISTCNRTEIYVVSDQVHTGIYYTQKFLADYFGLDFEDVKSITETREGDDAIYHLYRVTAGLDSMVVGETQILGQMREAFLEAQEEHTTGKLLNRLFQDAMSVAKRGHTETDISKNAVSISYAAVELAKNVFKNIKEKRVLVVGAGEMAEESLLNLTSNGITDVTVINRSEPSGRKLAEKYGGQYRPMNELSNWLIETDIVISSTRATDFVITADMVNKAMQSRPDKSLLLIDIALPRDIEPEVENIPNVYTYNVDDLNGLVDSNLASRLKEAEKIEQMIDESVDAFNGWLDMQGVRPVIQAMRMKALDIHETTFQSVLNKMPNLSKREQTVISKHMKSIINQILRDPITYTKELAGDKAGGIQLTELEKLFGIEDIVEDISEKEAAEMLKKNQLIKEKQLN